MTSGSPSWPDELLASIKRETAAVLDRCDEKLRRLEARVATPRSATLMTKYRAARARLVAEQSRQRERPT